MKKRLIVQFCIVFGLLCTAFGVHAATTSDSLANYDSLELIQSITGAEYKAPYVASEAGTEEINPMSGALNMRVTDLVLPGKNGMDLVISRTYNSQIMEKNYSLYRHSGERGSSKKYAYRYTYGSGQSCYILFSSEQEMLESGAAVSFSGVNLSIRQPVTVENGDFTSEAYYYSSIASANGQVTYTRVPSSLKILTIEGTLGQDFGTGVESYLPNRSLGQGWTLDMPCMLQYFLMSDNVTRIVSATLEGNHCGNPNCAWGEDCELGLCGCAGCDQQRVIEETLQLAYGRFVDENGQVFLTTEAITEERINGSLETTGLSTFINNAKTLYEGFEINAEGGNFYNEIEFPVTDQYNHTVSYTREITYVPDNIKYYFDYQGRLVAKKDKFGNSILYYYQSDNKIDYIIDSYNRTVDFVWDSSGNLSKITYGNREIHYNWESINNVEKDPHNEFDTDNQYKLTVTNEAGEATVYYSDLEQVVYQGSNESVTCYDNAYLLKQVSYPTGGKTIYTYGSRSIYMEKYNGYRGSGKKFGVTLRKEVENNQSVNQMTYTYSISNETLVLEEDKVITARAASNRGADGGRFSTGYDYMYYYTFEDKKLKTLEEQYGNYRKTSEKTYSDDSYGRLLSETNKEYMNNSTDAGLVQTSTYTYDDVGSLLTSTDGQSNTSNRYRRRAHLANGASFPKYLYRHAVSNGENRETVTISDYTGRPEGYPNQGWEGIACWREKIYDDTLNPDGTIVDGWGKLQYKRYYVYNASGEVTQIKTFAVDSEENDTGTPDVVSYSYAQETGYGTDVTKTRTVTETREANNVVQPDGTITASTNLSKTMTYDYYGNLIREEGDGIDTTCYTYDNKGRLLTKKVMEGSNVYSTVSYQYTVGNDTKTLITDENNKQTLVKYDGLGRYKSTVLDPSGINLTTEAVTYDDLGRVNCKTVSNGTGNTYQIFTHYWSSGKLWREEIRDSASNKYRTVEYNYSESWPDSDAYDTGCQRIEVVQKDGDAVRTSYSWVDVYGNTKKTVDAAGGVTTYDYDSKGELQSMKNPNDNANETETPTETYTYDYRGEVTSVTNALGNTASTVYDFLGRAVVNYDYKGNPTTTTYNLYGQQASVSTLLDEYMDPAGPYPEYDYRYDSLTQYFYDSDGNLALEKVKTSEPGAQTDTYRQVNYVYDQHLRLDYVKQTEDNNTNTYTKYFYDEKGNPTKVVTGLSSVENLTESNIPSSAAVTAYEYHPYLNTVTKMILPDGTTQYYDYNYWGQVEEQGYLDSDNQKYGVVETAYNLIGEVLSTTGEDDSGASYTYNKFGDVLTIADDTGTRTFTYDNAGRLTAETGANGNKTYAYDANGNRTRFVLTQNGQTVQNMFYEYDRLNRLIGVRNGINIIMAAYSYDANGNLLSENKAGIVQTSYSYNKGGQMISKTNRKASDNTVISSYNYAYYLDGNIKSENNRTFTYDNLGRLKQEQNGTDTISYTYDKFGNRASMTKNEAVITYGYDLNNRLTSEVDYETMSVTQYAYDNRGNLYSKQTRQDIFSDNTTIPTDFFGLLKDHAASTVELYSYDGLNRMTEARKGGVTAQYTYNAEGIRTSKTVNGITTDFLLDGANVVAETKNNTTTSYIRGVSGIISSEIVGNNNSRKYYLSDGHGNITNLTDSTGVVVKAYTYDAFGVEQNIDSNDTNPFRYCGEYYDSEIGQIYLRARYYNPDLGRFTQSDPARDGYNWYVYCGNNSVNLIDPLGLFDYDTKLSYNPFEWNPDVIVLQNELAYLGYLSLRDRTGYFGQKTLAAINAYKNDRGLWNSGEYEGIVGLTTWQSFGLIYRTQADIDAGVTISTIGKKQYFDITKPLNDKLYEVGTIAEKRWYYDDSVSWFLSQVNHGKPWDIKRKEPWEKTLGITYPGSYDSSVIFKGQFVTPEQLGNITYGYIGAALGMSLPVLYTGSFVAAFPTNKEELNNEMSDHPAIKRGYYWYKEK